MTQQLFTTLTGQHWMNDAACRNHARPNIWHPVEETRGRPPANGMKPDTADVAEAKRICGTCPVVASCFAFATQNNETGIWAGHNFEQRANDV